MTRDVLTSDAPAAPPRPAARPDRPAKVLVLMRSFAADGSGSAPITLAGVLAARGHTVLVAAADGPLRSSLDGRVLFLVTDDAEHTTITAAHELSRYLRFHRPDVIHSYGASCAVAAAVAVKAGHAACVRVMTHHAPGVPRMPRWIAGLTLRRCSDHFLAMSSELEADLAALHVPAEKVTLVSGSMGAATNVEATIEIYRTLMAARASGA